MICEKYEPKIVAYVLGELAEAEAEQCHAHIEACEHCRSIYEKYACLVDEISRDAEPIPTLAESESLSQALAQIPLHQQQTRPDAQPYSKGLPALIFGSLVVFCAIAVVLSLQVLGHFNLAAAIWSIGPAPITVFILVAIFVTSFLPIAVASKRRPLNGMTFRR
ncbi:zf-HC2 domain-containing protein [bacterium]|nr:zf-HC2 domain-containing protein [bacterium]